VDSYFARHTEKLSVKDEDLTRLWDENEIAIHYPDDSSGRQNEDSRSTDPADYQGRARTAIKYMKELEERGGYVWMESRVADGVAKVGLVGEGTSIELEEAQWEVKDGSSTSHQEAKPLTPRNLRSWTQDQGVRLHHNDEGLKSSCGSLSR
jgi:hypothetical protein